MSLEDYNIEEIFVSENMDLETEMQENQTANYLEQHQFPINTAFIPSSSSTSDTQQSVPVFIQPGAISPSISSISDSSSVSRCPSTKKARLNSSDDTYANSIMCLAESMRQPITISTIDNNKNHTSSLDPVDSFVTFLGSLLKSFQNEELKLEVMNNVTQIVIKEKSKDLKQGKKD